MKEWLWGYTDYMLGNLSQIITQDLNITLPPGLLPSPFIQLQANSSTIFSQFSQVKSGKVCYEQSHDTQSSILHLDNRATSTTSCNTPTSPGTWGTSIKPPTRPRPSGTHARRNWMGQTGSSIINWCINCRLGGVLC